VAYCHDTRCYLSYNLVLRAAKLGYRNLYWLRDGIAAYPTMLVRGEYSAADAGRHKNRYRSEIFFCRSYYRLTGGKEGAAVAALIERALGYPEDSALIKVAADNDKEVSDALSEAKVRDAAAKKAGKASYAEDNYNVEWTETCDGMMRGFGLFND
jgi:hypothetical protein